MQLKSFQKLQRKHEFTIQKIKIITTFLFHRLYSNRAACHYKVRNLIKCVEDCTRVILNKY